MNPTIKLEKKTISNIAKVCNLVKNNIIADLESVKFNENGDMTITDLTTTVIFKGVNIVNAETLLDKKQLNKVLSLMPEFVSIHTLEDTKNKIDFISPDGKEKLSFAGYENKDYPETFQKSKKVFIKNKEGYGGKEIDFDCLYEVVEVGVMPSQDWCKITEAMDFCSDDELRPAMQNVYVNTGNIWATDANIAYYDKSSKALNLPLMLPPLLIKLVNLLQDKPFEISAIRDIAVDAEIEQRAKKVKELTGNRGFAEFETEFINYPAYYCFENESVKIIHLKCDEYFPELDKVIPEENNMLFCWQADKKDIAATMKKALAIITAKQRVLYGFIDTLDSSVLLSAEDDYSKSEYSNKLTNQSIDNYSVKDTLSFGFAIDLMTKALKVLPENFKWQIEAYNKGMLLGANILLMPCMPKPESE